MNTEIKYALISNIVSGYAMITCFDKRKHIIVKVVALIISITFMIAVILALTGCTTQVTAPCPKPNIPAPPVDYMAELKPGTPAPEFVRACLKTRLSAIPAYYECAHVCGSYQ